jgi:hypothetical protein
VLGLNREEAILFEGNRYALDSLPRAIAWVAVSRGGSERDPSDVC